MHANIRRSGDAGTVKMFDREYTVTGYSVEVFVKRASGFSCYRTITGGKRADLVLNVFYGRHFYKGWPTT